MHALNFASRQLSLISVTPHNIAFVAHIFSLGLPLSLSRLFLACLALNILISLPTNFIRPGEELASG